MQDRVEGVGEKALFCWISSVVHLKKKIKNVSRYQTKLKKGKYGKIIIIAHNSKIHNIVLK